MHADLAPHVKNALLGRWVVFEALDRLKIELTVAGCGTLIHAIESGVCERTAYTLDNVDARPLPDYLQMLGDSLRSHTDYASIADKQELARLFDTIDERIALAISESKDPLDRLCDSILKVTLEAYEHFVLLPPTELFTPTEFRFAYVAVRPDLSFPPLAGSAQTLTCAQPPVLSQVELQLSIKEFDLLSFNSLPYAIFHECVSHVFQGPWNNARKLPDSSSLYAEGWMDFAAFLLYRKALEGGLINISLPQAAFPDLSRPSYSEAAALLHYARRAESLQDRSWAYRAMGAQAAEWLTNRITRLPDCHTDSETAFLQLSFSINASALDQDQREEFAHLIHHALQHAGPLAQITPLLRDYYRFRNSSILLTELWRLSAQWTTSGNMSAPPTTAPLGRGSGGFSYTV